MTTPMDRALKIGLVYDAIMKSVTNFQRILEMRLINKAFNSACLRHLRKSHDSVVISMKPDNLPIGLRGRLNHRIVINGTVLKYGQNEGKFGFKHFSWFLRCIAKIKVKRLEVRNFGSMSSEDRSDLHQRILRDFLDSRGESSVIELIGMYNLCPQGCQDCLWLTKKCYKYGPIQTKLLGGQSQLKSKHFEELHVSDLSLAHIALLSERSLVSSESLIPTVTCDNLLITIADHNRIPIDILRETVAKWGPKSIEIKVTKEVAETAVQYTPGVSGDWKLNEELMSNVAPVLKNPIAQIKVNFSDSKNHHLRSFNKNQKPLIPNILKLFPTRKLIIINPRETECFSYADGNIFRIIEGTWSSSNLTVDVQMFPKVPDGARPYSFLSLMRIGDQFIHAEVQPEQLRCGNLMGKVITYGDPIKNLSVSMTWWADKGKMENYYHRLGNNIYFKNSLTFIRGFIEPDTLANCETCKEVSRADEVGPVPLRDF